MLEDFVLDPVDQGYRDGMLEMKNTRQLDTKHSNRVRHVTRGSSCYLSSHS